MPKFINIAVGSSPDAETYILTVRDNGDVTGTDNRMTLLTLASYFAPLTKKVVTASAGQTITDAFLANPITEFSTGTQNYIIGEDFTQNTGTETITFATGFFTGQKVLLKM